MIILDGKKIANQINQTIIPRIERLKEKNISPTLAVVLANETIESKIYVTMKQKTCEKLGIQCKIIHLIKPFNNDDLLNLVIDLNGANNIHAILVQLPLPKNIDKHKILSAISPEKDVDGLNPLNSGKLVQNNNIHFIPCTVRACMELLDHYKINIKGKHAVIIGSSILVGLPLSTCLLHRGATITLCNINTADTKSHTKNGDIIISCCGVPQLIKKDWVKKDAVILDVGINQIETSQGSTFVGDVDFDNVKDIASYITPVPGGIGPMTISMLIKQIVETCERNII
jgi:methylenetetrahydrofolate dehydrogenase (NADP+)/methenyltetrahydrofolate cyclohydrolase